MRIKMAHFRDIYNEYERGNISISKVVEMLNEVADAEEILYDVVQICPTSSVQEKTKFGKDMIPFYIEGFITKPRTTIYDPFTGQSILHTFDGELFSLVTNDSSAYVFAKTIENIIVSHKRNNKS